MPKCRENRRLRLKRRLVEKTRPQYDVSWLRGAWDIFVAGRFLGRTVDALGKSFVAGKQPGIVVLSPGYVESKIIITGQT